MSKPSLLLIGGATDRMMDRFEADFTVIPKADFAAHADDIVAVATNGHDGVPANIMAACPNIKVVSCYGVGYDAIDTDACNARSILVSHTPNVLNDDVANTAILLMLGVSRSVVRDDAYVRAGDWVAEGNAPLTNSVENAKVGIIGMGRIGERIAQKLTVFTPHIQYHARSKKDVPYTYNADLVGMATDVDILICIVPGGPATDKIVNTEVMDALGKDGMLINVARGTVVDEAAMVKALQDGRLGYAGLDVFEAEPKVPEALFGMENVLLLPHVASATHETRRAMGDLVTDNLSEFLKTGSVLTPIPECQ
jgi:lactate dehydrogenase-like 2-hydroxyacid dehydrogenase